MMKLYKYSKEQLMAAVKKSTSMRQVLLMLHVAPYGGNYGVLKKAIRSFDLDISHFTGQAWNKGKKLPPKYSLDQYLNNEVSIQSYKLRNRLLRSGVFKHRCARCLRTTWMDQPIPLELDHINGDNKNNKLNNLRLLCPNCHAMTPTFRNRKRNQA